MAVLNSTDDLKLLPHQQECFDHVAACMKEGKRPFILWFGGVRAGKTLGAVACLLHHSSQRKNAQYIIGTVTGYSAIHNIFPYFEQLAPYFYPPRTKIKTTKTIYSPKIEVGGNMFIVYAGIKPDSFTRVQGLTADGVFLDEFSLLDRKFVKQCETRISKPGALRIYTSNKDKPYGWAYRDYFSRADIIGAHKVDVTSSENTFLDKGYLEDLTSGMEGDDYRKYVLNEYVTEVDPVFQNAVYRDVKKPGAPEFIVVLKNNAEIVQLPFYMQGGRFWVGAPGHEKVIKKAKFYMTNDRYYYHSLSAKKKDVRALSLSPSHDFVTEIASTLVAEDPRFTFSPDLEEHIEQFGDLSKKTLVQTALLHGLNYVVRGHA